MLKRQHGSEIIAEADVCIMVPVVEPWGWAIEIRIPFGVDKSAILLGGVHNLRQFVQPDSVPNTRWKPVLYNRFCIPDET